MVMYGIYSLENLEILITTVHKMHNFTVPHEKLFASTLSSWYSWYLTKDGVFHYAINSLLYLKTIRENVLKCMKNLLNNYTYMQM